MSLPRGESVDKNINPSSHPNQHPRTEATVLSSSSSLGKNHSDNKTTLDKGKLEESDEDLFRVPDVTVVNNNVNAKIHNNKAEAEAGGKRRRGRNPVDKEYRRLKRLLRNRVSAQQARERKKVYVNDLESKAKELQDTNSRLEEKISTLINENTMLRKVLMNSRPKADEHASKERIVGQELTRSH